MNDLDMKGQGQTSSESVIMQFLSYFWTDFYQIRWGAWTDGSRPACRFSNLDLCSRSLCYIYGNRVDISGTNHNKDVKPSLMNRF